MASSNETGKKSSEKKPAAPDTLIEGGKSGKPELSEEDLNKVSGGLMAQKYKLK